MSTDSDHPVSRPPAEAARSRPWGLLGLNAVLLLVLGIVTFAPRATGQFMPRGNTLAISARTGLSNEQVLWLFDPQTMELVAVGWDRTGTSMNPLGRRNVARDVETLRQSR